MFVPMQDEGDDSRERRARARASWPVVKFRLGEEPGDEVWAAMTPEDRVRLMWPLTVDAWILAGRAIPDYDRASTPARLFRPGEAVPDEDGEGL
jgi:hypothetical protein